MEVIAKPHRKERIAKPRRKERIRPSISPLEPKVWQVLAEYLEDYAVPPMRALPTFRARKCLFRLDVFGAQLEINKAAFGLEINDAKIDIVLKFPNGYKGNPGDRDFVSTMKVLLTILRKYDV